MLELDSEVTVTVTTQIVVAGVPVMVILVEGELVVVGEGLKNAGSEEPSFLALTCIFTPPEGIVEVICTIRGKSGPGAGASVLPLAGVVCTARVASWVPPLLLLFLQAGVKARVAAVINKIRIFFITLVITDIQ